MELCFLNPPPEVLPLDPTDGFDHRRQQFTMTTFSNRHHCFFTNRTLVGYCFPPLHQSIPLTLHQFQLTVPLMVRNVVLGGSTLTLAPVRLNLRQQQFWQFIQHSQQWTPYFNVILCYEHKLFTAFPQIDHWLDIVSPTISMHPITYREVNNVNSNPIIAHRINIKDFLRRQSHFNLMPSGYYLCAPTIPMIIT